MSNYLTVQHNTDCFTFSLEEMEEYVKNETSNTNLKPLKLGKEKCEYTRERLGAYEKDITKKSAKFVLHPILAQILEQIENFSMGKTLVLPMENDPEDIEECKDEYNEPGTLMQESSKDPIRTTFMRSNSSKLIDLPEKKRKASLSRQSTISDNSTSALGKKDLKQSSNNDTSSTVQAEPSQKQSKLITRSKTSAVATKEHKKAEQIEEEGRYRIVAGLRATLAERSASAPLLNLPSKRDSVFVEKKPNQTPTMKLRYKEALQTKKHTGGCYITGISVLPNGTVVLCDSVHDSLQLYDPEIKQISEMICPHPWGVAAVSDTAVAVSLHYDHKIILVQASKTLERINEKDITLKCNASLVYDVKYYAYRLYTLCIEGDVHILDLKGREYGKIKTGMPTNTLKYFDIDLKRENMFISSEKGVICLNFQGLPLWHFKPQSKPMLTSTGVLVSGGRLLICDWENNQLVELYDDGQRVRTVFSERMEKPVAVCQSSDCRDIFVTQGDYEISDEKARIVNVLKNETE